jgi:hypothetical protein
LIRSPDGPITAVSGSLGDDVRSGTYAGVFRLTGIRDKQKRRENTRLLLWETKTSFTMQEKRSPTSQLREIEVELPT